jgi:hypothetical protein
MNEPKQSVDPESPAQGRLDAWWRVRPILRVILLAEILAGVGLFFADETSAAVVRVWVRPIAFVAIGWETAQAVLTVLAILAVIAVLIEALRKGRLSTRRNDGGLKVASAPSV